MQIFVDADACPVVSIVEKVAKEHDLQVTLLCDTNHVLSSDYSEVIVVGTGAFQTEEGCLSLEGVRPCTRYKEIEVDYLDANFKKQHGKYSGWTAQIIQHETDHCNGGTVADCKRHMSKTLLTYAFYRANI